MLVKVFDKVQVRKIRRTGESGGQFGKVVALVPGDDSRVVVRLYRNGVTTYPHLLRNDLIVCTEPHYTCW